MSLCQKFNENVQATMTQDIPPNPNLIKVMVARYPVCDSSKSGTPRATRSDENRQRLAESVDEDPLLSVRR